MKKLVCLLILLSITVLLFACDPLPDDPKKFKNPITTEPSTQESTEKPVEPSNATETPTEITNPTEVENPAIAEIVNKFQNRIVGYISNRLYIGAPTATYGRVSFTDLATGEVVENIHGSYFSPTAFIQDDDTPNWKKAVSSPEGLFEDATHIIRVENLEDESWYVEFHNGKDARYIYFSELNLYVPIISHSDHITEAVNQELDAMLEYYFLCDPEYRVEASTYQKVAETYADRVLQLWQIRGTEKGRYTAVSVDNVSYELQDNNKTLVVSFEMTATPLTDGGIFAGNVWDNEDGSQTCLMTAYLAKDENGKWYNTGSQKFYNQEE